MKCNCGRKSSQMICPLGSDNPDIQKRIREKGLSGVVSSLLSGKKVDIGKYMELKNIENLDCDEDCQKEDWKRYFFIKNIYYYLYLVQIKYSRLRLIRSPFNRVNRLIGTFLAGPE